MGVYSTLHVSSIDQTDKEIRCECDLVSLPLPEPRGHPEQATAVIFVSSVRGKNCSEFKVPSHSFFFIIRYFAVSTSQQYTSRRFSFVFA